MSVTALFRGTGTHLLSHCRNRSTQPGQLEAIPAEEILIHRGCHFSRQCVAKRQSLFCIILRQHHPSSTSDGFP